MNFVHIVGRLTKDPETRFTSGGQKVTTFAVASNTFRSGNEETIFWRVTLWGDRWDKMMQHFTKGKMIMIGGEMRKPGTYTDKNGATQMGNIEVTADYVKFVPMGRSDQEGGGQQQGQSSAGSYGGDQQYGTASSFSAGTAGSAEQGFSLPESADEDPLPF